MGSEANHLSLISWWTNIRLINGRDELQPLPSVIHNVYEEGNILQFINWAVLADLLALTLKTAF